MNIKSWFERTFAAAPERPQAKTLDLSQMEQWGDLTGMLGPRSISPDLAMTHSAVYACVRVVAGSIAMLPLQTYERVNDDERRRATGLRIVTMMRSRPNPRMSAAMFWRTTVASMLLRGNGYAWIERSIGGEINAIWPIRRSTLRVKIGDVGALKGRLIYGFVLDDGTPMTADQDDIIHFPGTMEWDGIEAKTPIKAYADAVGTGLGANDYARRFFDNDATPTGYIKYPEGKKVVPEQVEVIRSYWERMNGGENRHRPAVLSEGAEFKTTGITAEDAQLIETRGFQVLDIARIFGVPPHMIGAVDKSTSWGSGLEEQTTGFVVYTLGAHLSAIEQEINWKIYRLGSLFAEYDRRALVMALLKERNEAYRSALGGSSGSGWMTINEVRRLENLPPVPQGDEVSVWSGGAGPKPGAPAPAKT